MADSKTIQMIFAAKDLASKPVAEIGNAVTTLAKKVDDLAPAAERGEGSIKELESVAKDLESTLRGLAANQAIVERFQVLSKAFAEASAKLEQLKQRSADAAAALSRSAAPNAELKQQATQAAAAFNSQEKAVARLAAQLQGLSTKAGAAGIDVKNLAGAERQIGAAVDQAAAAYRKANTAIEQHRNAIQRIGTSYGKFRSDIRSIVTGLIGLYAAVRNVASVIDAVQKQATVKNTFDVAFGSEAASQLKEVEQTAGRLGFRMLDLALAYGKFSVAAKSVGTTTEDTQTIFNAFAGVSRALNLDTQKTSNVFLALEQVMSKGKFAMEELRQQLGDALPGALGTLSNALKIPQDELIKLIENGKLSSKFLLNFALEYQTKFAGAIEAGSRSPAAAIGRFQTALDNLKLTIANGGFLESIKTLLERLSAFFKSSDGERFAKALGAAMKGIADVLIFLVENIRVVAAVLGAAFGAKAVALVVALGSALKGLAVGGVAAATSFKGLATALAVVRAEFLGLIVASRAAALAVTAGLAGIAGAGGFALGSWLRDSSAEVRKFGIALVGGFLGWIDQIRIAWAKLKFWSPARQAEIDRLTNAARARQDSFADDFAREGQSDTAPATRSSRAGADAAKAQATADAEAARRAAAQLGELNNAKADATLKAATELQDKLDNLRAESLKRDAQTREEYQAAVRLQFADLAREIDEFGKKTDAKRAARMKAQLAEIISLRVSQAGEEFDVDAAKRAETQINELITDRKALVENINVQRRAGFISEAEAAANTAKLTSDYNDQIEPKIRALLAMIAALPSATQDSLRVMVSNLQTTLKVGLNDRPDNSEFLQFKEQAEKLALADKAHTEALRLQKELLRSHQITQSEYNTEVDRLRALYSSVGTDADDLAKTIAESVTLTQAQRDALEGIVVKLQGISDREQEINEKKARYLTTATEASQALANALVPSSEMLAQIRNIGDAWIHVRDTMRTYFADLLANKAKEIIAEQILQAIRTAFGYSFHTGGVVGAGGSMRTVNPAWFANAPRYHTGGVAGVAGLGPREVPAVLERGEEVLKRNDPRHVLNGGGQGGGQQPLNVKVVNSIDSASVLEQGAQSAAGERAILNVIRANASSIKSVLR